MVVADPEFPFFAHVFGTEDEGVDESWIGGGLPETMTKMPESM